MSRLELINQFWERNNNESLGSVASSMYFFLLYHWSKSDMVDFKLSDVAISESLSISRPTIKITKEKLQKLRLIQYTIQNGTPCLYKIIEDYNFSNDDGQIPIKIKVAKKVKEIGLKNNLRKSKEIKPIKSESKSEDIIEKTIENALTGNYPLFDEFLIFSKTLKSYSTQLDLKIEEKYNCWIHNGWKNDIGRPITNWKALLRSIMPYIADSDSKETVELQNIERPKLNSL